MSRELMSIRNDRISALSMTSHNQLTTSMVDLRFSTEQPIPVFSFTITPARVGKRRTIISRVSFVVLNCRRVHVTNRIYGLVVQGILPSQQDGTIKLHQRKKLQLLWSCWELVSKSLAAPMDGAVRRMQSNGMAQRGMEL